jgi:hypothetical protein
MGFGWEEVHDIAEEIELISSNLFFDKMNEIFFLIFAFFAACPSRRWTTRKTSPSQNYRRINVKVSRYLSEVKKRNLGNQMCFLGKSSAKILAKPTQSTTEKNKRKKMNI